MSAQRVILLAGILSGACLALAAEPAAPVDENAIAKQLAADIDSFNALDPQSPDTLNSRLAYANFLTKIESGDCRTHLDEAQNQLNVATANRALAIVLPSGLARIADVEYELHSARVSCGAGAASRDQELHAALNAAQRAADLYRDEFDAVSMVTMQFNVSVVYHKLGDIAAAAAALKTTLDLDREYGFEDDAAENYRLLMQWTNQDSSPEHIEAWMNDFPERSATLSFGWAASDATLTLQSDVSQLAGTDFAHFQASRSAQRRVRKGLGSWVVSFQPADPHFDFGELPKSEPPNSEPPKSEPPNSEPPKSEPPNSEPPNSEPLAEAYANSLARVLMHFHDYRISRKGDFDWDTDDYRFGVRARADAKTLARGLGSLDSGTNDRDSTRLAHLIGEAVRDALSPGTMEAQTAEDYNLAAGTWIGATLEQGVWYNITAALRLPLAPQAMLTHQIQFTYSRQVPCSAGSSELSCIEIVLRAAPDPTILKTDLEILAHEAHLARGQVPRLWSVTTMRLVTDPSTLRTYSLETRWHTYWSNGEHRPDRSLIEAEKTIVSMSAPIPISAPTPP